MFLCVSCSARSAVSVVRVDYIVRLMFLTIVIFWDVFPITQGYRNEGVATAPMDRQQAMAAGVLAGPPTADAPGQSPGQAPGQSPGQALLNRHQRRALAQATAQGAKTPGGGGVRPRASGARRCGAIRQLSIQSRRSARRAEICQVRSFNLTAGTVHLPITKRPFTQPASCRRFDPKRPSGAIIKQGRRRPASPARHRLCAGFSDPVTAGGSPWCRSPCR